jgi:hypothetical protein
MSDTKSYSSLTQDTSGYVGFANLPNQVHRKSVKKGFEFTLMVAGKTFIIIKLLIPVLITVNSTGNNRIFLCKMPDNLACIWICFICTVPVPALCPCSCINFDVAVWRFQQHCLKNKLLRTGTFHICNIFKFLKARHFVLKFE